MRSKTQKLTWALLLASVLTNGCASGTMSIQSRPEGATVAKLNSSGQATILGKTPLIIDNKHMDAGLTRLQVSQSGYFQEHVLLPPTSTMTAKGELFVELSPVDGTNGDQLIERGKELSSFSKSISQIQHLINKRELPAALTRIEVLLTQYPSASVLYDLQGNVHFLSGKMKDALTSYEKSLTLYNDNPETKRMVDRLKTMNIGRAN